MAVTTVSSGCTRPADVAVGVVGGTDNDTEDVLAADMLSSVVHGTVDPPSR